MICRTLVARQVWEAEDFEVRNLDWEVVDFEVRNLDKFPNNVLFLSQLNLLLEFVLFVVFVLLSYYLQGFIWITNLDL